MSRRLLKLAGATIALGLAVLLAVTANAALDAGSWWLASLATVAMWLPLGAVVLLIWSAARPERATTRVMFNASPKLTPERQAKLDAIAARGARRGGVR